MLWLPVPVDSRFTRQHVKQAMVSLTCICMIRQSGYLIHNFFNKITIKTIKSSSSRNSSTIQVQVCDVAEFSGAGVYFTVFNPILDVLFRWLGPMGCLWLYIYSIVRKIYRERRTASYLMQKIGILPPAWFYSGILEMESIARRTMILVAAMCVLGLPNHLYLILQPLEYVSIFFSFGITLSGAE